MSETPAGLMAWRSCARATCPGRSRSRHCSQTCKRIARAVAADLGVSWCAPVATMGYGAVVAQAGTLSWLDVRVAA